MIEIFNQDCMEFLETLENESVDLILTDPPYNISGNNKLYRDYRSGEHRDISFDFGEWDYNFNPIPFLELAKTKLNKYGSIIVWTSEQLFPIYRQWFAENMYPKQMFIWVKQNPIPQFRLIGYRQATEIAYWASNGKITKDNPNFIFQTQKEMTNVFFEPIVAGKERTEHPTQKPLSIFTQLVRTHCREGGLVVDPFLGSGTTAVACAMTDRNFKGCELDKKYFDIAQQRVDLVKTENSMRLF